MKTALGLPFYYRRQYDEAVKQFQKAIEADPGFAPAHSFLGWTYEEKGMYREAIAAYQKARTLDDAPWILPALGHAYARSGRRGEAQKVITELKELSKQTYIPPYYMALTYIGLEEEDQALHWLEKGYEDRYWGLAALKVEPKWDSLRSKPRFADLMRRMRFAP